MLRFLLFAIALGAVAACGGDGDKTPASPREYVYVIDSANGETERNAVIVVDPATRSVVTTLPATYSPDAIVDPRGGHLLVTRWGNPDFIDEYKSSDWAIAETYNVDGRFHEIVYPPAEDWLKMSADGNRLYYGKYGSIPGGCGPCNSFLGAVDLQTGGQVMNLFIDECGLHNIDVSASKPLAYVTCSSANGSSGGAHVLDLNTGALTPVVSVDDLQISVRDAQHEKWYLISRSMNLYTVDTAAPDGTYTPEAIHLNSEKEHGVESTTASLSPDGSRLYVGALTVPNEHSGGWANEIWGFDTRTLERTTRIELKTKAFHFAVSLDGRTIYSVDPDNAGLTFTDIASAEQETMSGVGEYPAKVLVGPK